MRPRLQRVMEQCAKCSKPFEIRVTQKGVVLYCSHLCSQQPKTAYIKSVCPTCKKEFLHRRKTLLCVLNQGTYCSKICMRPVSRKFLFNKEFLNIKI